MNQVILNGNIGGELKTVNFQNGGQVVSFSLATNQFYKDKDGQKQTNTQWHSVKIFGGLGEAASKILSKGDKVLISGTLKYDEFETKEGVKKTSAFIEVSSFEKQNAKSEE